MSAIPGPSSVNPQTGKWGPYSQSWWKIWGQRNPMPGEGPVFPKKAGVRVYGTNGSSSTSKSGGIIADEDQTAASASGGGVDAGDFGIPTYDPLGGYRDYVLPGYEQYQATYPTEASAQAVERMQRARNYATSYGNTMSAQAIAGGAYGSDRGALAGAAQNATQYAQAGANAADQILGQDISQQLQNNQFNAQQNLNRDQLWNQIQQFRSESDLRMWLAQLSASEQAMVQNEMMDRLIAQLDANEYSPEEMLAWLEALGIDYSSTIRTGL